MKTMHYRSELSKRIYNLSLKIEKIAKDARRLKDIREVEKYASLQKKIEEKMDETFELIKEFDANIKKDKR